MMNHNKWSAIVVEMEMIYLSSKGNKDAYPNYIDMYKLNMEQCIERAAILCKVPIAVYQILVYCSLLRDDCYWAALLHCTNYHYNLTE